jgi:hypothetical protein
MQHAVEVLLIWVLLGQFPSYAEEYRQTLQREESVSCSLFEDGSSEYENLP